MGPLTGVRVLELAGLGAAPFAGMVLSDLGADVLRIDRAGPTALAAVPNDPLGRGRRSVVLDLKSEAGLAVALRLADLADVLIEGFRPGVAERLGIGPAECAARNPRLVYARMTGWGQRGPLAARAGHDINYIALAGALDPIGRAGGPPVPPLNLIGDFGGGGMLLALGVTAALLERERSGQGQVIDAAMVDGAALLTSALYGLRGAGLWVDERGTNLLDGGAPFYDTYVTADGRYVAVGALEPQFYAVLLDGLELSTAELPGQHDRAGWPVLRERFAAVFQTRTRDQWAAQFADTDACVTPVLNAAEAPEHPHNAERGTFTSVGGLVQPSPAPRLSRTPAAVQEQPAGPGEHADTALRDWGLSTEEIADLRRTQSDGSSAS